MSSSLELSVSDSKTWANLLTRVDIPTPYGQLLHNYREQCATFKSSRIAWKEVDEISRGVLEHDSNLNSSIKISEFLEKFKSKLITVIHDSEAELSLLQQTCSKDRDAIPDLHCTNRIDERIALNNSEALNSWLKEYYPNINIDDLSLDKRGLNIIFTSIDHQIKTLRENFEESTDYSHGRWFFSWLLKIEGYNSSILSGVARMIRRIFRACIQMYYGINRKKQISEAWMSPPDSLTHRIAKLRVARSATALLLNRDWGISVDILSKACATLKGELQRRVLSYDDRIRTLRESITENSTLLDEVTSLDGWVQNHYEERVIAKLRNFETLTNEEKTAIIQKLEKTDRTKIKNERLKLKIRLLQTQSKDWFNDQLFHFPSGEDERVQLSQIFRRDLIIHGGEKVPFNLPQRIDTGLEKSIPIPQILTIPNPPQGTDILKLVPLIKSLDRSLPLVIHDDLDENGVPLRSFTTDVFLKRMYVVIEALASTNSVIEDNFRREMPKDLRIKVTAILGHLVNWAEDQQRMIREETDLKKKKKMELDFHLDLKHIIVEQIGLSLFHCNDRIATSFEQVYMERIASSALVSQSTPDQLRSWVASRLLRELDKMIVNRLKANMDQATNLRYYRHFFAPQLGIEDLGFLSSNQSIWRGVVAQEILEPLKKDVKKFHKLAPKILISEITDLINDVNCREKPFQFPLLSDLFHSYYLEPEDSSNGLDEMLVDENYQWKQSATAQLLFDIGILKPFKDPLEIIEINPMSIAKFMARVSRRNIGF